MATFTEYDIALVGNEKQDEINIYMGGRNKHIINGHKSGPFIRDFFDIEYCSKGSLTLYLNNVPYEINEGDFYVIPPQTPAVRHFNSEVTSTSYVGAKGLNLSRYFKIIGITPENPLFPYKLSSRAIDYFEKLIDSLVVCESLEVKSLSAQPIVEFFQNTEYTDYYSFEASLKQNGLFSLFLSELMNIHGKNTKTTLQNINQKKYVEAAIRFIEANYSLDIGVDTIAKYIGIDRSYLFRLFREELGVSVRDYIIQVRMRAACDFLHQPDALVKNVAASVNYDTFAFSRVFKKVIGISPIEYREKHKSV